MLLSNDKELFHSIIERASFAFEIGQAYIEKDFYAISILKELVSRNKSFVFKGGTSLSVCQQIIDRFSEDIDISYEFEQITVGQRRDIKQTFFDSIEAASLKVANPDNIRSRRVFNRYICPYDSEWNPEGDQVIVEWATQTPSFPIEEKTAQTIIGKYLESIGRNDLVKQYNLESFKVKTIAKERTLVDKVFAICDYHLSGKLTRQSRHIYDIYQLMKYVKLDNNLIKLFNKVKDYRVNLDTCLSAKENMIISDLLKELVKKKTYLNDYSNLTFPLLYNRIRYEECIPSILKMAEFLKEYNM